MTLNPLKRIAKASYLNHIFLYFAFLFLLCIAYFSIGKIGFYLDDFSSILYNPIIKPPIDWVSLWQANGLRALIYSVIAIEYSWFGDQAQGYHYIGVLIHIGVSILLLLVLSRLAVLSKLNESQRLAFVFFALLLFVLHPQNSQAVVYIIQQTATLAAFFSLLTLYLYINARQSLCRFRQYIWLLFAFFSFILAMVTKQNSIIVPVVILLIEWLFFGRWLKGGLSFLFVSFVSLLIVFIIVTDLNIYEILVRLDQLTRENSEITRLDYFRTQLNVIGHYLLQFFLPVNLRLEYDNLLIINWDVRTILWGILHCSLLLISIFLRKKCPLFAFGILGYYCFHIVESSFLPIRDLTFEHRTYLPNTMLVIAISSLLIYLFNYVKGYFSIKWLSKTLISFCITAILLLTYLTHQRVNVWADKLTFYQNEVKFTKKNPRPYARLGGLYVDQGNCGLAIGYFEHAMALYRKAHNSNIGVQPELLQNYITCLRKFGLNDKAEAIEKFLLLKVKEPKRRAAILSQQASRFMEKKQHLEALPLLREAFKLDNKNYAVLVNLAICEAVSNNIPRAEELLKFALVLKPNDELVLNLQQQLTNLKRRNE